MELFKHNNEYYLKLRSSILFDENIQRNEIYHSFNLNTGKNERIYKKDTEFVDGELLIISLDHYNKGIDKKMINHYSLVAVELSNGNYNILKNRFGEISQYFNIYI